MGFVLDKLLHLRIIRLWYYQKHILMKVINKTIIKEIPLGVINYDKS